MNVVADTLSSTSALRACILHYHLVGLAGSQLRPHHCQEVHVMGPADFPSCQRFSHRLDQRFVEVPRFLRTVLPTDETLFERVPSTASTVLRSRPGEKIFSSVFYAVLLQVDPRILERNCPQRPSAAGTARISGHVLPEVRRIMWITHDGVTGHCSIDVCKYLNTFSLARWVGRNVPCSPTCLPAHAGILNVRDLW